MMFKSLIFGAMAAALILALGSTPAVAQDNIFALSYFSNAHTTSAPDGTLRLVNDGTVSDASPAGDLCASIYVFDSAEELNECCSCKITPNGILSLSVNTNLTSNTLTGKLPTRGVIKVVSSKVSSGSCDARTVAPQTGIRGWITHVQKGTTTYSLTEEELLDSTYGSSESADLAEDCTVLVELGSGAGVCSCADTTH
jgi:hypothetical protein